MNNRELAAIVWSRTVGIPIYLGRSIFEAIWHGVETTRIQRADSVSERDVETLADTIKDIRDSQS